MSIGEQTLRPVLGARTWMRFLRSPVVFAYLLLTPAILTMVVVVLYPVLSAIDISFRRVDIYSPGASRGPWTLANYARLLDTTGFWQAVRVSVAYVVIAVVFSLLIGFGTALLLNQRFRGRTLARMLVVLPWSVPPVVAVNVWWWILDPSFGMLNWVLLQLGVIAKPINWIASPTPALAAVSLVTIWKGYPFFVVMLLAGLQAVPQDLYDAGAVDGAGRLAAFQHITLPALRGVLALATLLTVLWVFREFTIIWVLTGGGPVRATETLAIMTYREAFANFRMGFAASIGVVTLLISTVASVFFIRQAGKEFH
ncbi:MAG: sugar ABC transporter permease [Armatimonadota bacterium]|nr:sugar ABC transporter permease [Armatimonadota bacterium]